MMLGEEVSDIPGAPPASSIAEWKSFLLAYSAGDFDSDHIPPRPLSSASNPTPSRQCQSPPPSSSQLPVYTSTTITDETARAVRSYTEHHDHLPPPRSPYEEFRERLLLEYDIMGPVQTGNIQTAIDLLAAFFPNAFITFTLFRNSLQTIFAIGGTPALIERFALRLNVELEPLTSLCGHSVLLENRILFSPRMAEDWRFRSNPYTLNGICSYIGSAVTLKCDTLDTDRSDPSEEKPTGLPESLGIGAINIMFADKVHEEFTDQERLVVTNVTNMLVVQLRATWEGHTRTKEAQARKVLTELIHDGFDGGYRVSDRPSTTALQFPDLARSALEKLIAVTELSGAALLDLRGICTMPGKRELVLDSTSQYPLSVIASLPTGTLEEVQSPATLLDFLNNHGAPAVYTSPESSGLETHLPDNIRAHVLIPFFSLGQPVILLLGVSHHIPISPSTLNIARSIGSVLLSSIVQTRVMEADAAKTAFLSSISHELRTPLYGILSGVELANKTLQDGDTKGTAEILNIAQASGLSLSHILNDVLDFARASEDNRKQKRTRVDIAEAAQNAARMCIVQFGENEEAPSVVLDCEQRIVLLNEAKYHRIIINGLTNACKFCSSGTISISISYTNERLVTRITDTGIGFDMQSLPRLLEPFTKQDQHTPGAGLGLHITKQLVESLGGILTLSSEAGKGTSFEVILPVQAGESKGSIHEVLQQARKPVVNQRLLRGLSVIGPTGRQGDKLRVLIVDDNAVCLKILYTALKRGSVPVDCTQATDGAEAVRVFEEFEPELVLTDVSMPVMDGVEAARHMRAIQVKKGWKRCIIYALTGLGQSDPRLKSLAIHGDAELDGWLVKGLDQMKAVRRIVAEVEAKRKPENGD